MVAADPDRAHGQSPTPQGEFYTVVCVSTPSRESDASPAGEDTGFDPGHEGRPPAVTCPMVARNTDCSWKPRAGSGWVPLAAVVQAPTAASAVCAVRRCPTIPGRSCYADRVSVSRTWSRYASSRVAQSRPHRWRGVVSLAAVEAHQGARGGHGATQARRDPACAWVGSCPL